MYGHGMAPIRAGSGRSGPFRRTFRVFGSSFLPESAGGARAAEGLERGDKVILHASALGELHDRLTQGPLVFEVSNPSPAVDRKTHVGVLEFSGDDPHKAYMPSWVMDNLLVGDGDPVNFRLRTLPKVTFVKLQPADYSFAESVSEPRAALEHVLRNFTALTLGDRISVHYASKQFSFTVTELRPAKAVSVVQAECEVDFDEPAGGKPTSFAALKEGEPLTASVEVGDSNYYSCVVPAPDTGIVIRLVTADGGDADVYVSATDSKPSRASHTWAATSSGGDKSIRLAPTDPAYPDGETVSSSDGGTSRRVVVYVAVHGYRAGSSRPGSATTGGGRITGTADGTIRDAGPAAGGAGGGPAPSVTYTLSATTLGGESSAAAGAGSVGSGDTSAPGPGKEQCDNCMQYVPERTIVMHGAFCRRNNYRCPDCGEVMRIAEKEKHADVRHKPVACECGREMQPDLLTTHRQFECELRKVPCDLCGIDVPIRDLDSHKEYCGARTVPCDICRKAIVVRRLQTHLAVEHGVNPSLPDGVSGSEARAAAVAQFRRDEGGKEDEPAAKAGSSVFSSAPLGTGGAGSSVVDSRRRFPPAAAAAPKSPTEILSCPYCSVPCPSFDELQVHLLTTCPRSAEAEASGAAEAAGEAQRKADAAAALEAATVADRAEVVGEAHGTSGVGGQFGALIDGSSDEEGGKHDGAESGGGSEDMRLEAPSDDEAEYEYESAGEATGAHDEGPDSPVRPGAADDDELFDGIDEETMAAVALSLGHIDDVAGGGGAASADESKEAAAGGGATTSTSASAVTSAPAAASSAESGSGAPSAGGSRSFECPACSFTAASWDDVQVHMLTACDKAAENAAMFA